MADELQIKIALTEELQKSKETHERLINSPNYTKENQIERYVDKWLNNTYVSFYKNELDKCIKSDCSDKTEKMQLFEEIKKRYKYVKKLKYNDFANNKLKMFIISKMYGKKIKRKISKCAF